MGGYHFSIFQKVHGRNSAERRTPGFGLIDFHRQRLLAGSASRGGDHYDKTTIRSACEGRDAPPGTNTIVGADKAECQRRLEEMEAFGKPTGRARFTMTGVKRAERGTRSLNTPDSGLRQQTTDLFPSFCRSGR
jgi:hypothetical protein